MKIILVRHGQTQWNVERRLQGHIDIKLNETGIEQARKVAEYLKDESFDYIVSSDLKRVSQTADAIVKYHQGIPYKKTDQIREKFLGVFQGKTLDEIFSENDFTTKDEYYEYVDNHKSVETEKSISERINQYMDTLVSLGYNDICIVSHSGAIKRMREYFRGVFDQTSPRNCSVSRYEYVDGVVKEVSFSESEYLD